MDPLREAREVLAQYDLAFLRNCEDDTLSHKVQDAWLRDRERLVRLVAAAMDHAREAQALGYSSPTDKEIVTAVRAVREE